MKLWKHDHYNGSTKLTTLGEDWKEPYLISDTQPDTDYTDVSDEVEHWSYADNLGTIEKDYLVFRDNIIIGMTNKTWLLMSSEQKQVAIDYFAKESGKDSADRDWETR